MMGKWDIDSNYSSVAYHDSVSELPHDKTNKMTMRPVKTQISLGIRLT